MIVDRSLRPVVTALVVFTVLLSACAAVAQPPPLSAPSSGGAATQYDVVVVGAGLAGLTTARSLVADGHKVLVVEATNRIGGRAYTDTTSFSIPVDLGAAWIHGVDKNPLTTLADWLGFERVPTNLEGPVFIGNQQRMSDEKLDAFGVVGEAMEEAMAEKTRDGEDLAVSQFLPESEFRELLAANIGPLEAGTEAEQTSSLDASSFESDVDDFVAEGIGTLVARLGEGLEIRLNSPVTAIQYGDDGVAADVRRRARLAHQKRERQGHPLGTKSVDPGLVLVGAAGNVENALEARRAGRRTALLRGRGVRSARVQRQPRGGRCVGTKGRSMGTQKLGIVTAAGSVEKLTVGAGKAPAVVHNRYCVTAEAGCITFGFSGSTDGRTKVKFDALEFLDLND